MWEANAKFVEKVYGGYVDWEERFYNCPECGEPIYECDWDVNELVKFICPICEFTEEDGELQFAISMPGRAEKIFQKSVDNFLLL